MDFLLFYFEGERKRKGQMKSPPSVSDIGYGCL